MRNVTHRNIFFKFKKKLLSFKVIKLNKLFLKLKQKRNFLKSNKFILASRVFLLKIEEIKLKKRFL